MTLDQWLAQWTHKSAAVQQRVQTALGFMRRHNGANADAILSEMRCIDFSHAVALPVLPRGTMLVGFKDSRVSPYRARYFTRSGHPIQRLGVADSSNLRTNPTILPKQQFRYEVLVPVPPGECLESVCSPAMDTWSMRQADASGRRIGVPAGGGALQYLIPNMNRFLRALPP